MVECLNRFEFGLLYLIHQATRTLVRMIGLCFICVMIALRHLYLHVFKLFVGWNSIQRNERRKENEGKTEISKQPQPKFVDITCKTTEN